MSVCEWYLSGEIGFGLETVDVISSNSGEI
jgi:hypothetical protein